MNRLAIVFCLWLLLVLGCASPENQRVSEEPVIEVLSERQTRRYGYSIITGEIRNISNGNLDFTQVEVAYRDANGALVASSDIYIANWRSFPAGSTSTFEIMTPNVPRDAVSYNLIFKSRGRQLFSRNPDIPDPTPSPPPTRRRRR